MLPKETKLHTHTNKQKNLLNEHKKLKKSTLIDYVAPTQTNEFDTTTCLIQLNN